MGGGPYPGDVALKYSRHLVCAAKTAKVECSGRLKILMILQSNVLQMENVFLLLRTYTMIVDPPPPPVPEGPCFPYPKCSFAFLLDCRPLGGGVQSG